MEDNKKIVIGSIICLLPMIVGIMLWEILPENLVRHIGPGAYSFSSKKIVVFLYPFFFLLLNFIVVFKPGWLNTPKSKKRYWYTPILSSAFFFISFVLSL